MTIQNTNLIFQKTYGSLTPKVYSFHSFALFYNQPIGVVYIPVDVDKVRVQDSGMMAYCLDDGITSWHSFSNIMGEWPIN